jgi:hypothetical protein
VVSPQPSESIAACMARLLHAEEPAKDCLERGSNVYARVSPTLIGIRGHLSARHAV